MATQVPVCNRALTPTEKPLTQPDHPPSSPRTVLLVDDEDIVRELIARSLLEGGYRVRQAHHGAAAIGLLEVEAQVLDLVVCDLVMPIVGGREVASWMREHCPDLPLLFISGYPRGYLEAHDLYDPTVAMLRKPFLPSRLLESVEELLARSDRLRSPS